MWLKKHQHSRPNSSLMTTEEELYYPSSENKGADQLRGYREADLRLCFRLCSSLMTTDFVITHFFSIINMCTMFFNVFHENNPEIQNPSLL